MKVDGLSSLVTQALPAKQTQKTGNFAAMLKQYTQEVNHDVKTAAANAENLAVKGTGNVSETMLAVQEAGLSFQLMMAARNKMVDAYREVMRMQI